MPKKTQGGRRTGGPRAPAGKRPLTVIVDETVIEEAKIRAIRERTSVSSVAEDLLRGWLAGLHRLPKR